MGQAPGRFADTLAGSLQEGLPAITNSDDFACAADAADATVVSVRGRRLDRVGASVIDLIGDTPLVRINNCVADSGATILGKLEAANPGGSVKDRTGLAMLEAAEEASVIEPGRTVVIEPTSGNTGIALAMASAAKGYRCVITMPETMSIERRQALLLFGAELVLTPAAGGMQGAIDQAIRLRDSIDGGWIPQQFENPANPAVHVRTTAEEIWRDTEGEVDIIVSPVGTGGTATGCAQALKPRKPSLQVIGVEPARSAVISGGPAGPHRIQGIGAGFVPEIFEPDLMDEIIQIDDEEAEQMARQLCARDGIFVGISAGAGVAAARQLGKRPENSAKLIVSILCDTGERYLSHPGFESVIFNAEFQKPV